VCSVLSAARRGWGPGQRGDRALLMLMLLMLLMPLLLLLLLLCAHAAADAARRCRGRFTYWTCRRRRHVHTLECGSRGDLRRDAHNMPETLNLHALARRKGIAQFSGRAEWAARAAPGAPIATRD